MPRLRFTRQRTRQIKRLPEQGTPHRVGSTMSNQRLNRLISPESNLAPNPGPNYPPVPPLVPLLVPPHSLLLLSQSIILLNY